MADGTRIGVIGLGRMGSVMAARLVEAGYDVTGFDPAPGTTDALVERGGRAAGSPAEAIKPSDVVILMLPDSNVVENVVLDPASLDALHPGLVLVDMGSSEPLRTVALAQRLDGRVAGVMDAPVSGGVVGAVNGTLAIMVGGEGALFGRLKPIFQVLGSNVVHVGPIGAGHALKALNNLMSATHLWSASEALRIGQAFGLDVNTMLTVVNASSGRSGSTEVKWPKYIVPGTFDSGFALRLMLKDMKIAIDLADSLGVSVELGRRAADFWEESADELPPTADHTEIVKTIDRRTAGLGGK